MVEFVKRLGCIRQQAVAVVVDAQIVAHAVLERIGPVIIGKYLVEIDIGFRLCETHHVESLFLERDDLPDIEPAGQVIHGHRQDSGHKDTGDRAIAHPRLDHLEKRPQERIARGYGLIERILVRRQKLVREVVVFVDDDVQGWGTLFACNLQ